MAQLANPILFLLVLTLTSPGHAGEFRVGKGLGYSSGSSSESGDYSEEPLGLSFFMEHTLNSRIAIGGRHTRSMTWDLASSIGSTVFSGKYYFSKNFLSCSNKSDTPINDDPLSKSNSDNYSFFAGLGTGYAQSSTKPSSTGKSASAVGPALSVEAGADFNIFKNYGLRVGGSFEKSIFGIGKTQILFLGLGVYGKL